MVTGCRAADVARSVMAKSVALNHEVTGLMTVRQYTEEHTLNIRKYDVVNTDRV